MPRRCSVVLQFGSRLRELRGAAGLTQAEVSERADVAVETISRLETNKLSNPTIEVAEKLADALGVPITAFFDPTSPKPRTAISPVKTRLLGIIGDLSDEDVADVLRALQLLIGVRTRRRSRAKSPAKKPIAR